MIKKTIANITFGLLEKGYNKLNKSKIFDSLKEALYYQNKYGGKIYTLDTLDDVEYEEVDGRGDPKERNRTTNYYIVSISGQKQLMNGFRYIK